MHPYPANPLTVIRVKGDDREMGRQHAEQMKEVIRFGMPAFYYRLWKHLLYLPTESRLRSIANRGVAYVLDRILVRRLLAAVPTMIAERVRGMTDVADIPYEELATALVLPDLMPLLQAEASNWGLVSVVKPRLSLQFGCSSFISRGKNFLHGRNLDFPGVGYWDRYQALQVTSPTGKLRYIGFVSAGVPICGMSGVNEAQVSVSLHQHYGSITSLRGEPPFCVGERVLAQAKSLAEAEQIIGSARYSGSWAFILSDGKTREGMIVEVHPRARGKVTLTGNVLSHSNCFQTRECGPSEYATTERMNWDNQCRKNRLQERVGELTDTLAFDKAVQIIGEHFDPYWGEEKIANRTIAQVYNIQSYVLDPEKMKLAIAVGDCPVQLREYVEYDLAEVLDGREGKTGKSYPGFRFSDPKMTEAREKFILSFVAAFDTDFEKAESLLTDSLGSVFFSEGAMVLALLKMKRRDFAGAAECLKAARESMDQKMKEKGLTNHPPEYFECCLYMARVADLQQDREKALGFYHEVAEHRDLQDENLRRIALRAGPYRLRDLEKIVMPYSSYIPFQ